MNTLGNTQAHQSHDRNRDIPEYMSAVLLMGHGGLEKLIYRDDVPVPQPKTGEVLIQVAAAGVNNTDINTRVGWYSKSVSGSTESSVAEDSEAQAERSDGSWSGVPLNFPLIQGADVCGVIVAVGEGVRTDRIGQRVLATAMQPDRSAAIPRLITLGSERNGGFAQFVAIDSDQVYAVDCDWSDAELGSVPCAYSTAEGMLHRAQAAAGDRILITGASGGVGSAAIQLAKRRGAVVIAVAAKAKHEALWQLGADAVIDRSLDLGQECGLDSIDLVLDLVGGEQWAQLLSVLKFGGRYAVAGAIAGPLVELDLRTLYLKDLQFFGCTYQPPEVFANLIGYIERGEIRPLVAQVYPLDEIYQAQQDFMTKRFSGKLVLIPPPLLD